MSLSWDSYLSKCTEEYLDDRTEQEKLDEYEADREYFSKFDEEYLIRQADSHVRGEIY